MAKELAFGFLGVPQRPPKPRSAGWTIPSDYGLSLRATEDLLEVHGDIIDYVKFTDHAAIATRYEAEWVKKKVALYKRHGIGVFPGGVTFELATLAGKVEELFQRAKELGFTGIEVSEDVLPDMSPARREAHIHQARGLGFDVFTEIGKKYPERPLEVGAAVAAIRADLQAGSKKVTIEKAEIALLKRTNPQVLLDIAGAIGLDKLVFEAGPGDWPDLAIWLIRTLGPEINLENLDMEWVHTIDAFRLGIERSVGFEYLTKRAAQV